MKKLLIIAMLATSIGLNVSADTVTKVFYGIKARNSAVNPCKGATTQKCAEIKQEIIATNGVTIINETVTDYDGRIISHSNTSTTETPERIINEILISIPQNAEVTITPDDDTSEN